MALHPTVAAVTARIVEKSRETRADYIRRMDAARDSGTGRAKLSCANWAPRLRRPDHRRQADGDGRVQAEPGHRHRL